MKHLSTLFLFSLILFSLAGCKKDENNNDNTPGPSSEIWGNGITCTVYGDVRDLNGNPIAGAVVRAGNLSATTDPMGVFRIENAPAYQTLGYIRVEKAGYFLGSRSFTPISSGTAVHIVLLPKTSAGSFSSTSGGNISSQGVNIAFAANGIVRNNSPYNGPVNVALQFINPTDAQFEAIMPGDLIAVQNNEARGLTSYGMVAVELTDNSGQTLDLASGTTATVTFPIPATLQSSAPNTIDLWSFDETNGYWAHEGTATRSGNVYTAQVSHFSFWNCDVPWNFVQLNGTVMYENNQQPVSGARVTISSQSSGTRTDITNAQGAFGGAVPNNQPLTITIEIPCGGSYTTVYTANIGPYNANVSLGTIYVNTQNTTLITGSVVDCNNQPIAGGYVTAGGQAYFCVNGQFSFTACGSSITVTPYGSPVWVQGTAQTITLSGGTKNIGALQVCSNTPGGTVSDIDGNSYATVQIGNQEWMAENLKTTRYANGDVIPKVSDPTQWSALTTGAWVHFNDNSQYENPYGKLYNWYAASDPRNVCPAGWHVPTDAEWDTLVTFLGGYQVAGGKMKVPGTAFWQSPNTGATNESGFSALPGGTRGSSGAFYSLGDLGVWWSSSADSSTLAWSRGLNYGNANVGGNNYYKEGGFSVRCVRD